MNRPGRLVLIGHPVAHSLSPAFQNAALRHARLPLVYESLDVPPAKLAETLERLVAESAAGNVTIPHKRDVYARCDVRTGIADRVGAVNTFWTDGTQLVGDNTDVGGFQRAVVDVLGAEPRGVIALLGAGGSAAAVCAAASLWSDVAVRVVSRSESGAAELARRFPGVVTVCPDTATAIGGAVVVVNATPLGMADDDPLPMPVDAIPRDALLVDLVYRRGATAWVRAAHDAGVTAIDGLPMLLEQGALAFERWFGVSPDRDAMRHAVA